MLQLFDPDQETTIEYNRLPHWYQPGITYFITFRTKDSVPVALMDEWQRLQRTWLKDRGYPATMEPDDLPLSHRREFHRVFSAEFLDYLDRGHGECVLKRPDLAMIVMNSLKLFDGDLYVLADAVVMPNHVHVLVGMKGTTDPKKQCRSWKHYTAVLINEALGRKDEFWQTESFDHAVRTPEAFVGFRNYIVVNPAKAALRDGEYLLYSSSPVAEQPDYYRIRLREPWEVIALEDSRIRRSRRFGRPRQLDLKERIWLVIEKLQDQATVRLNGHELARTGACFRFDVTELLKENNRVEVEVGADREMGEVALEIG